jgi:hypothetical protein
VIDWLTPYACFIAGLLAGAFVVALGNAAGGETPSPLVERMDALATLIDSSNVAVSGFNLPKGWTLTTLPTCSPTKATLLESREGGVDA